MGESTTQCPRERSNDIRKAQQAECETKGGEEEEGSAPSCCAMVSKTYARGRTWLLPTKRGCFQLSVKWGRFMQESVRVYTPVTLARRWLCSERHIRNMIERGELKVFRIGGKPSRLA